MEVSQKNNRKFFFEDPQGNLWLVPRDGYLCYYNREDNCLRYHYIEPDNPYSIVSFPNRVQFKDNQGNWWICSETGLKKLSFYERRYELIPIPKEEYGVRGLMTDHLDRIWSASRSGQVRIFTKDMKLIGYLSPDGSIVQHPVIFHP